MLNILKYGLLGAVLLGIMFYLFQIPIQNFFLKNQQNFSENIIVTNTTTKPEDLEVYYSNLEVPWEIAFLPNQDMLVTLRKGELLVLRNKEIINRFKIDEVSAQGEGGLLGIAVSPKFSENNFIYLYYTLQSQGKYENKVVRFKLSNGTLVKDIVLLEDIRGNIYHNAGKIEFGPDGFLYITAGDALEEPLAQNKEVWAGKILRIDENGIFPAQNPFNNEVYSLGHRNPQGLTWDLEGNLWSTEHGQSGLRSGQDELNKIISGGNYGWPNLRGSQSGEGFISPEIQSGDSVTWAPGDTEYYNGNIFFTGLRGAGIYKYNINDKSLTKYLENQYGRLRAITLGPDGFFYITTSNRDGRGAPQEGDDKILKINPQIFFN
jgi:glucose/arabinose dehydrogenase